MGRTGPALRRPRQGAELDDDLVGAVDVRGLRHTAGSAEQRDRRLVAHEHGGPEALDALEPSERGELGDEPTAHAFRLACIDDLEGDLGDPRIALVADEPGRPDDLPGHEVDRGDGLAPATADVDELVDLALAKTRLRPVITPAPRLLLEPLEDLMHGRPIAELQLADGDEPAATSWRLPGPDHDLNGRRSRPVEQ